MAVLKSSPSTLTEKSLFKIKNTFLSRRASNGARPDMILAYSQKNLNYQLNYFGSVSVQFFLNKLFSIINGTGFGD